MTMSTTTITANTRTTADGKKITIIPANKTRESNPLYELEYRKTRVAAYARVSTELDEQQSSYEAQIKYYTDYINQNDKWEFAGIYADEGISGTSTKHREEFNRMITDAKAGKIDLILTKSISRFARNTLDTIQITRELKKLGVEVYFEKENLKSMDATTEVQLTILSSLAQDESRSLSQNVSWGIERRMREGKFTVAWSSFLGYDKGPDGLPVINEEEAKIVRLIFDLYLSGKTASHIAKHLEANNIPSPRGNKNWNPGTIIRMLQNEKYKGDAKIHKTFTVDYLSKKTKKNEGEVSQYYVTNSHPAIIKPATFDLVQEMIKKRARKSNSRNNKYTFNEKLVCNKCGEYFVRLTRKKCGKEYISWNCYSKRNFNRPAAERCKTKPLYEPEIINGYITAINDLNARRSEILPEYTIRIAELKDQGQKDKLTRKANKLEDNLGTIQDALHELITVGIREMAVDEFECERSRLSSQAQKTMKQLEKTKQTIKDNNVELVQLERMVKTLENLQPKMTDEAKAIPGTAADYTNSKVAYTDKLFLNTIEKIIVADNYLKYIFYGGEKIKIMRSEKRGSFVDVQKE